MLNDRIIRPTELAKILSVSKPTLWRWENEGKLPPRKEVAGRTVGWLESDIEQFLESLPNVREDDAEVA